MKMPFSFGARLVFRMVLPGLVIALILSPVVFFAIEQTDKTLDPGIYYPLASVGFGYLIMVSDQSIFMLFQGRRFWTKRDRDNFLSQEVKRLEELRHSSDSNDSGLNLESAIEISHFPLNDMGVNEAIYPTQLGNIIKEFEDYPSKKYGLDGIFYWYRLWLLIPKDIRLEIDEKQAVADGTIYLAFIFYMVAPVTLAYMGLDLLFGYDFLPFLPPWGALPIIALALYAGLGMYRLSLGIHKDFGNYFKALFDYGVSQLDLSAQLETISQVQDDPGFKLLDSIEARRQVWRYLRWHKIRGADGNVTANTAPYDFL